VTPPNLQYILDDMFENITLYDNRAVSATYSKKAPDKYEVTLRFTTKKLRAGELGAEEQVSVDDLVDVGVVDEKGLPLFLERRRVKSGETVVTMVVDRPPAKAGIDPFNKLIDRKPTDNLVHVVKQ